METEFQAIVGEENPQVMNVGLCQKSQPMGLK